MTSLRFGKGARLYSPLVDRRVTGGRTIHQRIVEAGRRCCSVEGCYAQAFRLQPLCKRHADAFRTDGHPTAGSVGIHQFRPWLVLARAFVAAQLRAGHPGVEAATTWFASELRARSPKPRRTPPPPEAWATMLGTLRGRGIEAEEMLARFIAAYACERWDHTTARSRLFATDEHFRTQAVKLLINRTIISARAHAKADADDIARAKPSSSVATRARHRPPVRRFIWNRVNTAVGFLALRAADEIVTRMRAAHDTPADRPERVDDRTPFAPATATTSITTTKET